MKRILCILLSCLTQTIWASDLSVKQITDMKVKEANTYALNHQSILNEIRNKQFSRMKSQLNIKEEPQQGALIFVSFSMPKASLKQILVQAKAYHIPVVIRGLVNNSFVETKASLDKILREKTKSEKIGESILNGAVALNPMWFRQFKIKQVPAFVVYSRGASCPLGKSCDNVKYDVLYGNISVDQALDIFKSKGSSSLSAIAYNYSISKKGHLSWNI